MGNRISTEDLYKITQSLADRAVSDVKKRREDERKREEAIKKNREERLAAAAKQNRIPNYKGGSLWDQYKAALASGEAKNASDFITKRDARNAAWNKVGAETLNDDMEALAKSISSTYGTQFDPSKYYSQETINGSSDQVKKMRDRLNALAEYYNTYGGSDEQKKAVGEQIKAYDSELKFLNDLGAHYGQYSSPEAYETLYDNGLYTEKYQGKNYSDIQNALKSTTNDREKAWLEKNADSFMTAAEAQAEIDRIEKAMGTKNIAGQRWTTGFPKIENGKLVYNDNLYDKETGKRLQKLEAIRDSKINKETLEDYGRYLGEANEFAAERALFLAKQNNILQHGNETFGVFAPDAKAPYAKNENAQNEASRLSPEKLKAVNEQSGKAFSFLDNADWATDDEKKIYDYLLYYKGGEEAKKYLRALSYELNRRAANALDQTVSDMYDKASGLGKTVLNIGSLGMNIIGNPEAAIDTVAHRIVGERVDPNSNNQTFRRIRNVIREKTGADLAKASEGTIFGKELFGENAANMLYGAAMSSLDSLLGGFTFGEGYTAVMGGGAMADEAERLYNKGASDSQIFNRSFAAGLAEYITEKVSMDNLLKAKSPANGLQVAKEILKQAGIEGSEEMASDVLNLVADSIIMADRSEMSESIQKYKDGYIDDNGTYHKGVSEKEAQKLAWQDFFTDAMADGLAGALSGGMMSAGPTIASYKYSKNRAAIQIPSIDPGNAEGLVSNARINDISVLTDVSEALKNGDAEEAGGVISEGIAWYEFLRKYGEKTYGKNQWSEVRGSIDDSISKLKKIQKLVADGSIDAAAIDEVLKTAETSMKTTPTVDVTSANDEKLFSLLAKGELSNSVIEKNILKDRGTLAAFERLTGLRIGGTTVSQKRAAVREAFRAVSSSIETLKAAQNAIESGATATEGHKNAAVIIDQAIQANRAENSRLRNSEKVKSAETKAAIDATNRQHRFLETVRNYVINGGDLSGFTESPVANVSGEGGTNSSETKTTQETAKKRVRADFSAYQDEKYSAEDASALANLNSKAEQDAFFRNENAGIEQEIKNIESSDSITAEEKAQRIGELKEAASRNNSLAKAMDDFREMGRLVRAGEVDKVIDSLRKPLKKMGVNIEVVDNVEAADGMKSGAYFDKRTNTIKVSRDWNGVENVVKLELAADGNGFVLNPGKSVSFDRAVTQTIAHEIAHADPGLTLDFIKAVAGTQYDAFDLKGRLEHPDDRSWRSEDARKEENWRRYVDAYTEQAMLEMKGTEEQRRASAEKVVNDAYIFEEIMADMFGAAVDDMGHSGKAGENIFWAMNRNKPGIIKRILNALERFIARIRGKDAYLAVEQRQAAERLRDMLTGELKRAYGTDVKEKAVSESAETVERPNGVSKSDRNVQDAAQTIEDGGTVENDSGEFVAESNGNGGTRWSLSTYESSGRETLRQYLEGQVSETGLTEADAKAVLDSMDDIYEICRKYEGEYAPFGAWSRAEVVIDEKGNPVFSVIKPNGEYAMNLDFSLVCKKRRALDAVLNRLIETGAINDFGFGQEEIVRVNEIIREHGFEIACDMCFVDAKRYRQAGVADQFVDLYNSIVKSMAKDGQEIDYFNFANDSSLSHTEGGIDRLSDTELDFSKINEITKPGAKKTVEYRVAQYLKTHPSDRKLLSRGDFMSTAGFDAVKVSKPGILKLYNSKKGTGGPKAAQSDVQYLNDILSSKKFNRSAAYDVGGVRVQSFSDYVPRLVFDYVQMIGDLAAKRLPAHAYTKEPLFAKQFGLTGMKINMSLMPAKGNGKYAGLNADGSYAWARESFPAEEAFRIQADPEYGKNVGTIAVGISDEHIWKMLSDPYIRMVIPYHKSGINPIVALKLKIGEYTDYTGQQNTRRRDGKQLTKAELKNIPDINRLMHRDGLDAVEASRRYVEWCEDNGYIPKFEKFAYMTDSDGNRVFNENYYKLLEDFTTMVDGEFHPQGDVTATFPGSDSAFGSMADLIKEGLEEDAVTANRLNDEVDGLAEEVRSALGREESGKRFSLTRANDEYMKAVESGNVEEQQRLVDEAAENAGYDSSILLHHGTSKFGFTKIDVAESDDGISFFATDKFDTAASYIPYYENSDAYDGIREIGKRTEKNRKVLTADSSIEDFLKYLKGVYPEEYRDARVITKEERYKFAERDVSDAVKQAKILLQYSIPKNVEDLVNMVIENEDNKSQWESIARAYGSFKDIPEITYNGMYFNEASNIWYNLQDKIRLLNIDLTKDLAIVNELPKSKEELLYSYEQFKGGENVGIYGLYAKHEGQLVIRGWGSNWNNIPLGDITEKFNDWWVNEKGHEPADNGFYTRGNTRNIAEFAKFAGYRSVCFVDIYDIGAYGGGYGDLANIYAFFYPESDVKSADPITYDDSGNVIPLTERFDGGNRDIRYSLVKSAQSELKALQKENEKLRQDVDDLKQELQLTHGRKLSRDALISSIQKILIDGYGVKLSAKELYPHVTNLYDMFYNNTVDGKRLKKDERVDTMRIIEEMDKIVDAVIENAVGVDDTYIEMKKLLPELRNTKLVVPMDARADAAQSAGFENWAEFRKANFGRVGFANEGLPVDTYYMELSERYPELFPDGITNPGEQAAHIADVVNTIRESGINEYQLYDIEDERIRTSIKNDVMDIIGNAEKLQTFADRAAQKVEDTKLAEAMHYGADIAKLKRLNAEKVADIKAENRKRLSDMRRKYQDRVESVRERYAEARANRSEKQKQTVLRNKVLRKYTEASTMLDRPTTENHFTEAMRKPLMEFLAAVDITTGKSVAKQGVYDRILRVIEAANNMAAEDRKNGLDIAETDLNVQEKQLIVDSGLLERMSAWVEANQGKKLTELSSAQLEELNGIFNQLKHLTAEIKRLYDPREGLAAKSWQAQKEIWLAKNRDRKTRVLTGFNTLRKGLEWVHYGSIDAYGFFNGIDSDVMDEQLRTFRKCQDKFGANIELLSSLMSDAIGKEGIPEGWHGKKAKEITLNLSTGTLRATPSQLMTVYLLLNQEDSRRCLFNKDGGLVIGKFKAKAAVQTKENRTRNWRLFRTMSVFNEQSGKLVLNEADANKIIESLTDAQIECADRISAILNGEAARLGNEVSMAMYGYKKYTTENYFPMRTVDDYRAIENNPNNEMTLLGLSFTHERTRLAGKALVAEDIFDVVGRHLTNMAQYNAFAQELDNAKKMYAMRLGNGTSLKQTLIRQYGGQADKFYRNLINNLSGTEIYASQGVEAFSEKLLSNYKAAAVAKNISVVLKQPMSIFRALSEFSSAGIKAWNSFKDLSPSQVKAEMNEMLEHSGVAKLKNWGASENMTRKSFEELYNNEPKNFLVKINDAMDSGAEFADMWTWSRLWRMSKAEIDAQNKYTKGSKEYFEAVNSKFSEVIGKTQVVQSALDSSMAVQNAGTASKFLYAFQNEPLKQYSYLTSAINDAVRGKPGAKKKLVKVIASSVANTAAVSAITTLVSLWRGTLDRDDDDELWDDILKSFSENALKDILSGGLAPVWQLAETVWTAIESGAFGKTVERMDLAALTDLGGLINKYLISQNGGRPNLGMLQDIVNAASNLFGWSAKNVIRDLKAGLDRIIFDSGLVSPMTQYNYLKAWKDVELTNKAAVTEAYYDVLRDAVDRGRYSDYVKIKRDMIYHGYTETKIKNAVMKSSLMDDLYELKKVNPGSYKAKVNSIVSSVSAVSSLEGKEFEDFIESAMKRREREDGGSKTDDEVYDEMHRKMEKEVKEQLIYIDVSKRAAYIKKMLKTYGEYGITEADILKVLRKAGKA